MDWDSISGALRKQQIKAQSVRLSSDEGTLHSYSYRKDSIKDAWKGSGFSSRSDSNHRPAAGLKLVLPVEWKSRHQALTHQTSAGSINKSPSNILEQKAQDEQMKRVSTASKPEAAVHEAGPAAWSPVKSFSSLFLYATTSMGIVFVNRHLFTSFEHPLLVSWITQTFAVLLFEIPSLFCPLVKRRLSFSLITACRLLPLAVTFVLMLISTNYCLKFQGISSYQVARSLTLVFNLLLSFFWLHDRRAVTVHTVLAVLIVSLGFAIASMDRAILTIGGLVTGVLGSLFQALYTVQIKSCLSLVNQDQVSLFYYNAVLASALLILPVYFTDGFQVLATGLSLSSPIAKSVWIGILFSSIGSAAVNFLSYVAVKQTSPLSYSITGYTKSAIQSCGGILLFNEPISRLSITGILLTLLGSIYYSIAVVNRWGCQTDQKDNRGREKHA